MIPHKRQADEIVTGSPENEKTPRPWDRGVFQIDDARPGRSHRTAVVSLGLFRRSSGSGRSSRGGGRFGGGSGSFGFGGFLLTADEAEAKAENDGGKGDANDIHRLKSRADCERGLGRDSHESKNLATVSLRFFEQNPRTAPRIPPNRRLTAPKPDPSGPPHRQIIPIPRRHLGGGPAGETDLLQLVHHRLPLDAALAERHVEALCPCPRSWPFSGRIPSRPVFSTASRGSAPSAPAHPSGPCCRCRNGPAPRDGRLRR